jgi:hypothetical protein
MAFTGYGCTPLAGSPALALKTESANFGPVLAATLNGVVMD